ncbi:hypothetical protein [Devosia riboflavina]
MTDKNDKPKRASARPSQDDFTRRKDLFRPQKPEDADGPDPLDLLTGQDVDNDMKTFSADDDAPSLALETDKADETPEFSPTEIDLDRKDRAFTLVEFGRPRTVQLTTGPFSVMRLTDVSPLEVAKDLAFGKASDAVAKRRLLQEPRPASHIGGASIARCSRRLHQRRLRGISSFWPGAAGYSRKRAADPEPWCIVVWLSPAAHHFSARSRQD